MPAQKHRGPHPDDIEVDVIPRDGGLRVDVIGPKSRWVVTTYQPQAERYDRGGFVPEAVPRAAVPEWVLQGLAHVGADRVVL